VLQSEDSATEFTWPLTFGFQEVTAPSEEPAAVLKLKALFREYVTELRRMLLNRPTAYIVLSHCTSCRTRSTLPSLPSVASVGMPVAAVGDTDAVVAASDGPARATAQAVAVSANPARM
jgi:hypothetical protein